MKRFPTGRWNREQPCAIEVKHEGAGYWAECTTHGYQGDLRMDSQVADQDAENHEREIFDLHRAGKRFVAGRWQ